MFVHVLETCQSTPGPLKTQKSQLNIFTCPPGSEVKPRDLATLANCHQCLSAACHAACSWSRRCSARSNVEILQSCKLTACPGSGKRVRNAEIATSPPSQAASCAATPPRQAAVARSRVHRTARTDVGLRHSGRGHSQAPVRPGLPHDGVSSSSPLRGSPPVSSRKRR